MSSVDLQNVADQVRAGVKKLQWLTNLGDALESIGSLEQAGREAQQRLDAVQRAEGEAKARLAEAEPRAQEMIARAEAKAAEAEAAARERMKTLEADAVALAKKRESAHEARIKELVEREQRAQA